MPQPMDFMAHELHQEPSASDVMALNDMLAQAETAEAKKKAENKIQLAAEIFEDPEAKDEVSLSSWLSEVSEKDKQLQKAAEHKKAAVGGLPPVRNSANRKTKQVVQGEIPKENREEQKKEKAEKMKKQQKYYSYDYFKEWDKFDVENEIQKMEEAEQKKEEYKTFSKAAVDFGDEVHDPNKTYDVEAMSTMEKRLAAKREKEKGNECMKAGEINAAVAYYSKSLELVPGDHLVLGNRAQAYIGIHCYLQATMDCDQALKIEPTYLKAKYRRAVANVEQGKFDEAIEDLEAVLAEQPDNQQAANLLTKSKHKLQRKRDEDEKKRKEETERAQYEAAPRRKIEILEDSDDEEDDEDDGLDSKALKQAREALKEKEEKEKRAAQEAANEEKAAAQRKRDEENRLLMVGEAKKQKDLGNQKFKEKSLSAAESHYAKALQALPPSEKHEACLILSNRALVYIQMGKFSAAEQDCTEAIKANEKWAKAFHRRGVAMYNQGQLDGALADFEAALKLEPESSSTIEEIRKVRQMQADQRNAQARSAPKKVQVVEVDDDSDEDEEPAPSPPGKMKIEEVEDDDSEGELIEDFGSVSAAPTVQNSASEAKKVSIVEVDDEESEEEGELIESDEVADSMAKTAAAASETKKVAIVEVDDDEDEDEPKKSTTPSMPAREPKQPQQPAALKKVQIIETEEDDSDDDEVVVLSKSKPAEVVQPEGSPPAQPASAPEQAPKKPELWEENGRSAEKLKKAKGIKDQADEKFKGGLFEQAAEVYSEAIGELDDEEAFAPERAVCFLNRAACRLQVRDFGSVIADCGEVLFHDADNVKGLVRRGLAYEGLEKYSKAAADMREALSIEYSLGGLTALGSKAKECLDRCKRNCPELGQISIPVRSAQSRTVAPPAPEKEPAPAAASQSPVAEKPGSPKKASSPKSEAANATAAKKEPEAEMTPEERRALAAKKAKSLEAEEEKNKGNAAFKAGKYRSAIMHYSAAIDLEDDNPAFYTNLSAAHLMLKDFANAQKMAEKALKLDDGYAKAHYRRGQALQGLGSFDEAIEAFDSGLQLLPSSQQMIDCRAAAVQSKKAAENAETNALAKIKELQREKAKQEAQAVKQVAAKMQAPQGPKEMAAKDAKGTAAKAGATATAGKPADTGAPKTGAEFKRTYRVLKKDFSALYAYMSLIPADQWPKLLSTGVEEEDLVHFLKVIDSQAFAEVAEGAKGAGVETAYTIMLGLSKVPRVKLVCNMLDSKDAKLLETTMLRLHPAKAQASYDVEAWGSLRKALGMS